MLNDGVMSSTKQDWETPQEAFDEWNKLYNFTFDPCCTLDSCKTVAGIFDDLGQDGLDLPWAGRVFMNPPYSDIKKWVPKAVDEAKYRPEVEFVVGLLPARTDTEIFHKHIWDKDRRATRPGVTMDLLPGRLVFGSDEYWASVWAQEFLYDAKGVKRENPLYEKIGKKNGAPFPSMLIKWEYKK